MIDDRGRLRVRLTVTALYVGVFAVSVWHIVSAHRWPTDFAQAWRGLKITLAGFYNPDLSSELLKEGVDLTLQTLATATLGSALGIGLGLAMAMLASRNLMVGPEVPMPKNRAASLARWMKVLVCELARLFQDILRAVPDFAWALLILTVPGPGPITGVLALGLGMGGILGKIYSEIWDGVDPRKIAILQESGVNRILVFFYGILPVSGRSILSYTLMRTECTVRNASVIGVVGGGGLGGQIIESFGLGDTRRVATLLMFVLVLTVAIDFASNGLRSVLRRDVKDTVTKPKNFLDTIRQRIYAIVLILVVVAWASTMLWEDFQRAWLECQRVEWTWIGSELGKLLQPDWRGQTWREAGIATLLPLSLSVVATVLASLTAIGMAWAGSLTFQLQVSRFCGEQSSRLRSTIRGVLLLGSRMFAVVFRAVPEVAWVLIWASVLRMGPFAALLALVLHSTGVLARLYVESVDNLSHSRLEAVFMGSRSNTFLYAALPMCRPDLLTYAFFQFESNLRASLVLGIVGAGGLGDLFHSSLSYWQLHRASTFLLAMVLLTTLIDRGVRRIQSSRVNRNS